jgi:hypothetical protein
MLVEGAKEFDFNKLYEILKEIKGIQGSEQYYPVDLLIGQVKLFREGKLGYQYLTKECSFREVVLFLHEKDIKIGKMIKQEMAKARF